jgi:hypothetical protein
MAQFISFRGMFFPAIESVSLKYEGKSPIPKEKLSKYITIAGDVLNPGENFLYKGPDREAMYMLKEQGLEYLGQDFQHDPEFLQKVRAFNFNTTKEYLEFVGYNEDKDRKRFEGLAQKVSIHELPSREAEDFLLAGGKDSSGDNDIIGGFGEPRVRPKEELKKTKVTIPV